MSLTESLLCLVALIAASAFFSIAEISLAAARRLRLRQIADRGDSRAERVLQIQEQPGPYFTVVQIGLNAVAILGGIVGDSMLSPYYAHLFVWWLPERWVQPSAFAASFVTVIAAFLLFADLFPKRLGMNDPERNAMRMVGPMQALIRLFAPVVWLFAHATDALFRLLRIPAARQEEITPADILAMAEAGARAGVLAMSEHQAIANVIELDSRVVSSVMTPRERIAWIHRHEEEPAIRARIKAEPFSAYPVCGTGMDDLLGYADAKEMFARVLNGEPLSFDAGLTLHKALVIPDRLTLAEVLEQFQLAREDFAIVVNEYSLVVGVITLNDVMSTVMGDLVAAQDDEPQIVRRDDDSWLIDGVTPITDVMRHVGLDNLPHATEYETLSGFLMVMLRRVPKRTDTVDCQGFRFEVLDVDNHRIDQVLVTRARPA